jgi:Uncharacterized conserved protein
MDSLIVNRLIEYVDGLSNNLRIQDIRIGINYTCVLLDNGSCGLSFVFRKELVQKYELTDTAGGMIGLGCRDIVPWAMDTNILKSSIGVACINALLQEKIEGFNTANALNVIDMKYGDTVGMIGYFKPVLEKGSMFKKIYVFERNIVDDENVYPDWAEDIYLPQCDVVIISGTTVVNKTIDHILSKCENAREIVIMGPTTPLCPDVFRDYGVNLLAGVEITDSKSALNIVSQGGGGPNLSRCTKKLCRRII